MRERARAKVSPPPPMPMPMLPSLATASALLDASADLASPSPPRASTGAHARRAGPTTSPAAGTLPIPIVPIRARLRLGQCALQPRGDQSRGGVPRTSAPMRLPQPDKRERGEATGAKRKRDVATQMEAAGIGASATSKRKAAAIAAPSANPLPSKRPATQRMRPPASQTTASDARPPPMQSPDDIDEQDSRSADSDAENNAAASRNQQDEHKDDDNTEGAGGGAEMKRKRGRRRVIHDEEQRKMRRKMQCKLNQRRYRARQRGVIETLSLETEKLSEFIQELEAYHRFMKEFAVDSDTAQASGAETKEEETAAYRSQVLDARPMLVTKQFFHLFRHGFALLSAEISEIQEQFLRFVTAPDLVSQGATERGVDALLLQLKRYTSYHATFEMLADSYKLVFPTHQDQDADSKQDVKLEDQDEQTPTTRMDTRHPCESIVAIEGKLRLRLSRDTIMLLYPQIIENEALSSRVIGQDIRPPFAMVLYFNSEGKVCKLDFTVDFVSAFMELLESAHDTALLLDGAIITPLSELGVDPHGSEEHSTSNGENKQLSLKFILL